MKQFLFFAICCAATTVTTTALAFPGQACQSVHVSAAAAKATVDNPPCGDTAACVPVCLSIPGTATRTGWTHNANPLGDGNYFRYTEISNNFTEGNQLICFEAKNWSDTKARDGQICIQYNQ